VPVETRVASTREIVLIQGGACAVLAKIRDARVSGSRGFGGRGGLRNFAVPTVIFWKKEKVTEKLDCKRNKLQEFATQCVCKNDCKRNKLQEFATQCVCKNE
jgi:hypothetical protein